MDKGISQLIKGVPALNSEDSVRRAAGLMQASHGSAVLVLQQSQILGMVTERAIAAYLASSDNSESAFNSPIGPLLETNVVFVNMDITIRQAAQLFSANDVDILPVIDNYGGYHGVLFRKDVVAALTKNMRPATVGGMATPLGVHLTSGAHTGGAGSMGLFLTGVWMMMMITAAAILTEWLQATVLRLTGSHLSAALNSIPIPYHPNIYDIATYGTAALESIIMLVLLRCSVITGYHAAEHMTVHTIEAGELLTPDIVRKMPRVHPRCGTNLLAGASIFLLITTALSNSEIAVFLAMVIVIVGWRTVGGWLQHFVTTKPPTQKQLENGIAAGEEILQKFQEQPYLQVTGFQRIWNMGFLQTASGMAATIAVISLLQMLLHINILPM